MRARSEGEDYFGHSVISSLQEIPFTSIPGIKPLSRAEIQVSTRYSRKAEWKYRRMRASLCFYNAQTANTCVSSTFYVCVMTEPELDIPGITQVPPDTELGKFWTLANILSMARLVIVLPVTYLIVVDGPLLWIMILLILALITDYFDGRVARWSHSVSNWGKILDPFADKMGGALVISALTYTGKLPVWFIITVVVRDLLIVFGGELIRRRTGEIGMSLLSGKLAVSAIAITVLAALLRADPPVMKFSLIFTTVLLVYSYLRYLGRFFKTYYMSASDAEMEYEAAAGEE